MPDVPQIVRERLRASTSTVGHPDPDLLTAFSERSLPESERAVVMEHLARCGDCREVVALALPVTEAVAVPHAAPAGSSWLTWPVLRWGVVAAGIVVIASVGIQFSRHRSQTMAVASQAPSRNEAAESAAQSTAQSTAPRAAAMPQPLVGPDDASAFRMPPENKPAEKTPVRNELVVNGLAAKRSAPAAGTIVAPPQHTRDASANAGIGSGGGYGRADRVIEPQTGRNSASVQQDTPAKPVANGGVPSQAFDLAQNQSPGKLTKSYAYAAAPSKASADSDTFARAKAPVPAQSAGAALSPPVAPLQASPSLLRKYQAPVARWTITVAGGLQRSFDGGNTWQEVNVQSNSLPAVGSAQVEVAATDAIVDAKKMGDRAMKDKQSPLPSTLVFRAVTASALDVWAGGTAGILYHSNDGGEHWARVVPSAAGVPLTGDILRLEFSDARNGTIATSTAELWTTPDAGQSWQKH